MTEAVRVRCYLMGSESLLIHCGEALLARGHEILGVITSSEPIASWAAERKLPVVAPGPQALAAPPCQRAVA